MNLNTMDNLEIIKIYQNYKRKCANLLDISSMYYSYDQKHLTDSHQEMRRELSKELKNVDFREFTRDELIKSLDFGEWDEDLVLCPAWSNGLIKEGTELHTISDNILICGRDNLSNDTRFGCFGYGFKIRQLREYKLKNITDDDTE